VVFENPEIVQKVLEQKVSFKNSVECRFYCIL